ARDGAVASVTRVDTKNRRTSGVIHRSRVAEHVDGCRAGAGMHGGADGDAIRIDTAVYPTFCMFTTGVPRSEDTVFIRVGEVAAILTTEVLAWVIGNALQWLAGSGN